MIRRRPRGAWAAVALTTALAAWAETSAEGGGGPASVRDQTDAPTARRLLEREVEQARRNAQPDRAAQALSRLAVVLLELGEFETGRDRAQEAVDAARSSGDPSLEAYCLGALGDAHFYLGELDTALRHYQTSHAMLHRAADRFGAAVQLKNIGIVHHRQGRYEEAIIALENAVESFREAEASTDLASALANLGSSYTRIGADAQAFLALEEALEHARSTGDLRSIQDGLVRLGDAYSRAGLPERALSAFRKAVGIADQLGTQVVSAWARASLAAALSSIGRTTEAIQVQDEAVSIAAGLPPEYAAEHTAYLGGLHLERAPDRAAALLERARHALREAGRHVPWWLHADLADALRRRGDLDRSVELFELAIADLEAGSARLAVEEYRAVYLDRRRWPYQGLVESLWQRHATRSSSRDPERAYEVVERARARSLAEALGEAAPEAEAPLDPDLTRRERQISARIAGLQGRLAHGGAAPQERRMLMRQLDRSEADLALVRAQARLLQPGPASASQVEPATAGDARRLVRPRTALLAYFVGLRHVFAFVITEERFEALRLDIRPDLLGVRVRTYVDLVSAPEGAEWQPVSRRLYADLIGPLRDRIPPDVIDLVIQPDADLQLLPFETLRDEAGFLVERFAVSYVPSTTVLRELAGRTGEGDPAGRSDLLVLASPPPHGGRDRAGPRTVAQVSRAFYEGEGLSLPPLAYADLEARDLRRMAGRDSLILVGEAASELEAKSLPLERFRIMHFATHALVSQRRPARSALLLAPGGEEDGFLQAREISRMRIRSDLVVLSACRTARGRVLAGEGVQGLTMAFLRAGARAVLSSVWDVGDEPTAALMRSFYRGLREGRPAAEALRRAKLATIGDPSRSAPRHWGAFILTGSARHPISFGRALWSGSDRTWLLVALALVVAAGLSRWVTRAGAA